MPKQKLEWIACSCNAPMRVIYIDDKPFVHPTDLEHMRICPMDDPQAIREQQEQIKALEEYY